jgi:REP element-mobilizing transposase RayT
VATVPHDRASRLRTKDILAQTPVRFSMAQIAALGRGFGVACGETGYRIVACAIMPDHVHAVILRHAKPIEQVVGHLRSRGTKQFNTESLRTDQTVWATGGWNVFLNSANDIARAIRYVQNNPIKAGLPPQHWDFITPWGDNSV